MMSPSFHGMLVSRLYMLSSCLLLTLNDTQFQPFCRLKYCTKASPPSKRTGLSVPSTTDLSNLMLSSGVSTISRPVLYCHRRKLSARPLS